MKTVKTKVFLFEELSEFIQDKIVLDYKSKNIFGGYSEIIQKLIDKKDYYTLDGKIINLLEIELDELEKCKIQTNPKVDDILNFVNIDLFKNSIINVHIDFNGKIEKFQVIIDYYFIIGFIQNLGYKETKISQVEINQYYVDKKLSTVQFLISENDAKLLTQKDIGNFKLKFKIMMS